jgi:hypothetical protein
MSHVTPNRLVTLGTAEMLAELSCEVESLGNALCSDADLVARHLSSLQAVDLIAQKLCGLAELLAADCAATGIARLRLESLRERFAHIEAYTVTGPSHGSEEKLWN